LALVGWLFLPLTQPLALDPECTADPRVRLVVAGQLFAIPRGYQPNVYAAIDDGYELLAWPICQRPQDATIKTRMFSIHPGEQPGFVEDELTRPLRAFQIEVHESQASYRSPREAYTDALNYLQQRGVQVEHLREVGGFRAYDSAPKARHLYLALPETLTSRDGAPLVIECTAAVSGTSQLASGRVCRTNAYQEIFEGVVFGYDFYDGTEPISTWQIRHQQIRSLIMNMRIGPEVQR